MSDTSLVFTIIGRDRSAAALGSASNRISKLKTSLLVGFGGITAAVGASINKAADFDKTIRQVGANASIQGAELKSMSDLALKMGADTSFSSQQAAQAMLELSKSGMTPAQIKASALANTLTLAAAGELELADSATVMSNALAAFGLKAEDSAKVAAALAGGANASTASVASLAEGLGNVGATAKQAGLTINDTVAILAEFDQGAIKGAEGGTQLKSMLLRLLAPQKAGAKEMKAIGFSARDAAGHMKPLGQIADDLGTALSGMGQAQRDAALKTIFGTYAIQGANTLLGQGSKKLAEYKKATQDMGAAQRMAETNTSGASGAFEQFHGAIESLQISFGLHLLPVVTSVTKKLTGLVNAIGGQVDPAMRHLKDLAHDAKPAFDKLRDAVSKALGGIDFSGISSSLMASSKTWAQSIIGGIQQGFDSGDWSGFGKSLGRGLGSALNASGDLALTFFGWIGAQIRKINWVDLGVAMGKQAPSLVAGLAIGILNFDLGGLLRGLGDHWFEVILGVLTIAFTPGRIIGKIAELLAAIPIAGPLLRWGVLGIERASKGIAAAGGRLVLEFLTGVAGALGRSFPRLGQVMEQGLLGLVHILMGGGPKLGAAVSGWGRKMLSALASVPGRMAGKGGDIVGGFLSGLIRGAGRLDGYLGGFGGRLLARIGDVSGLLYNAGKDFVLGFARGIRDAIPNALGAVGDMATGAVNWGKRKLHINSPSRLTMVLGRWFSEGFAVGIAKGKSGVTNAINKLVENMREKVQTVRDFAKDIREAFKSMGDVTSFDFGEGSTSLLDQLRKRVSDSTEFATGLTALRKSGLNATTLGQIRDAGPSGGLDAVRQLRALGSLSEVNNLVSSLAKTGGALGESEARATYGFGSAGPKWVKVKAAQSTVKVDFDFGSKGAENALVEAIRKAVRVRGGDVSVVFGGKSAK